MPKDIIGTSTTITPAVFDLTPDTPEDRNALLFDRTKVYEPSRNFWQAHPMQWAQNVISGLPEATHDTLATHAPAVHNYIQQQNMYAGVPGALTRLQLQALKISDPTQRALAQVNINSLRSLPPDRQELAFQFFTNPDAFIQQPTATPTGRGGSVSPSPPALSTSQAGLQEAVGQVFSGAQINPASGEITVSGDTSAAQIAAFYNIFPEMQGKVHFDENLTLDDVKDSFAKAQEPWLSPVVGSDNFGNYQRDSKGEIQFVPGEQWNPLSQNKSDINPLSIGESALGLVGRGGAVPFAAAGAASNWIESHAPGNIGPIHAVNNFFGAGARKFERGMSIAANGLGTVILAPARFGTAVNTFAHGGGFQGHDFDAETTAFVGNLGLVVALHEGGEALGAGKTALTRPDIIAAGELGVGEGARAAIDASLNSAAEASRFGRFGAIAEHPLRTLLDPAVRSSVYDMVQKVHSTSWADWVDGKSAGKFFDFIEKSKAQFGDSAASDIKQRYPMLPDAYIRELLDIDREQMPRATVDYADRASMKSTDNIGKQIIKTKTLEADAAAGLTDIVNRRTSITPMSDYHNIIDSATLEGDIAPSAYMTPRDAVRATKVFNNEKAAGTAVDLGNGIWKHELLGDGPTPDTLYIKVDAEGNVLSKFQVNAADSSKPGYIVASTLESEAGKGLASELKQKYYEEAGISLDNPEALKQSLSAQTYSEAGAGLAKKVLQQMEDAKNAARPTTEDVVAANNRLADLTAKRAALEEQVTNEALRPEPIYEFPNRKDLPNFLHRVLYRPSTATEATFRAIMSPANFAKRGLNYIADTLGHDGEWLSPSKQPFVAKLVDKLERNAAFEFDNPSLPLAERARIQGNNRTVGQRLFQKFGVPPEEYIPILQKLMDAKSYDDFYAVIAEDVFGHEGAISKYLPRNTPEEFRRRVLSIGEHSPLDYKHSVTVKDASGVSRNEPVLPGEVVNGVSRSLPSAPSEFAKKVRLPSAQDMENALSGMTRWAKNAENAGGIKAGAAYVYNLSKAVLHLTTTTLKVPALLFNLPAIIATKLLDETMGNTLSPNLNRTFRAGRVDIFKPDPNIFGNVISGFFDVGAGGERFVREVPLRTILSRGSEAEPLVFNTLAQRLIELHDDPMLSAFARTGLDLEKMKAMLTGGDPRLTKFFNESVQPQLERANMTMDTWLGRWRDSVAESTFNHPDFLKFAADGYIGGQAADVFLADKPGVVYKPSEGGPPVSAQYRTLNKEADTLRSQLSDLNPRRAEDAARIRALQDLLKVKLEAINHLEELAAQSENAFAPVPMDTLSRSSIIKRKTMGNTVVSRTNPTELAKEIENRFNGNEVTLPDVIRVDRVAKSQFSGVKSLPEFANDISARMGEYLYSRDGRFSFKSIGRAEARFARGSFYSQRMEQFYRAYRSSGMSESAAKEFAALKAGELTKDYFYDLTARSSVERQVRNLFWFAPVNGELLYRWLYAIPAQSGGWLPGVALTAAKAANYLDLFTKVGVIHKDPVSHEDVIAIPGLAKFIETISFGQVKVPGIEQIPLKSLNPHLSGPIPTLSPIPAALLNKAAQHMPALEGIAGLVAPYGDVTFVPYSIRNLLSIAGVKLPDASNDYVNQQWDRTQDIGYQYAYKALQEQGVKQPQLADYAKDPNLPTGPEQDAYMKDWNAWFEQLSSEKDKWSRGIYTVRLISGALSPGSIQSTSKEAQDYQTFFENNILPQVKAGDGGMDSATRDTLNKWLSAHPDSQAFAISYNYYSGKTLPIPAEGTDDAWYRRLYSNDVKRTMAPEDYSQFLAAMGSRQLYTARLNASISSIAPTGRWTDVLDNWYKRSQAVGTAQIQWSNYLTAHPEADSIITRNTAAMYKQYGIPQRTIEAQYVTDALTAMKALSGVFTGEDGLPDSEFSAAMGKIKVLNASLYTQTNGKLTPMEEGISWYFDKVISPYMTQTKPLYDEASALTAAGRDATAVYNKIDDIKKQYEGLKHGGLQAPSVDEFFYNSKSPLAQKYAQVHWTTQPRAWLSPFQRETAGYTTFQGEDEMWQKAQAVRDGANYAIDQGNYTPGSSAYESVIKWRDKNLTAVAAQYGPEGAAAMAADVADPYVRLQQTGFGAHNDNMQTLYGMVQYAHDQIDQAGYSASGYGAAAIQMKQWIYGYIANAETQDPTFKRLMETLSYSMKPDSNGIHPTGAPLYEAMFFGNFNPAYIPQAFIQDTPTGSV